ncbi:ATP-binding protein [Salinarimonas soli]|uniref:Transcriptional regulator n=1 Tax=Salinarimonas soli TaxID=1638099 RepID=A0A5B2VIP7_9HYPH|nr:winged helix-turn-helix domain-containing protein [Salinarimonas soli]KAA2238242.1 transcriptional regulator [Salinarimonas soli]
MNIWLAENKTKIFRFGPFHLNTAERILLKNGEPVEIGARALDLLRALVSRPNQNLSKRELIDEVWPDVVVEEGSLRVHIGALRKVLGDGEDGARYIATLAGRGYCFVAPVAFGEAEPKAAAEAATGIQLPARLGRMVGRNSSVNTITALLADSRFVTIVGSGGVGKTTLAVAVGHEMLDSFNGAVVFVDLGALNDPAFVAPSVASVLGLSVQSDDPTPSLIAYLKDKRIFLVLDNCEHVVEAAATLAMRIFMAAPQVHILATSREALRVEGEQVYKLMPLTVPPDDPGITADTAMTYSAVQLFVERAAASGAKLSFTDVEAPVVASICRKVDGLALALELAAGRVGTYGLQQTLALLDQRLTMLWLGQRTAPPRQKTLRALLDWSYELLSDVERVVLRRLAVFVGPFTIDAAMAVVTSPSIDEALVFAALDSLVNKSMLTTNPVGTTLRYRLSETTRAYALEIAADDAELAGLAARHASYYSEWLERTGAEWPSLSSVPERVSLLSDLGNTRAGLEWCFGPKGDGAIGIRLAASAAPLFLALSLLTECLRWSERALLAYNGGEREEMQLQAAFGMSLMFTRGNGEIARVALTKSLAIAQRRDDVMGELRSLSLLHMYYRRIGDYRAALDCAERSVERSSVLAGLAEKAPAIALAHSLLGVSLYHIGDLSGARAELERALELQQGTHWSSTFLLGYDHYSLATSILARTLWLLGYPLQAVDLARETLRQSARMDHPVTMSITLTWALSVFLWTGDLRSADELFRKSIAHSEAHSLTPNVMQGRGFRGELALRHGDLAAGIKHLQDCLKELRATRYELLATPFSISLGQGLVQADRAPEALALMDEAIELIKTTGELVYMPELLRVKARALRALKAADLKSAEAYLMQAIEWSRRQGSRSWELRAATELAAMWADEGRADAARDVLEPLHAAFGEGGETADLQAAASLLARIA